MTLSKLELLERKAHYVKLIDRYTSYGSWAPEVYYRSGLDSEVYNLQILLEECERELASLSGE